MSDDAFEIFVPLACACVVAGLTALFVAGCRDDHWRDRAVEAGHAEYFLDTKNQKQWRWKTNLTWVHVEQATNGNFIVRFPMANTNSITLEK